jgi:predicted ribosome quality control (RQC) complex YloA/Tae2 family protein
MSLNWKEIDLILSELDLVGGHVQRISQPDFTSLVLSIYQPREPFELYISLAGGKTRLHRLSDTLKKPEKLQRFAQLLRSRCKGGRITEAYQVHGDRIVKLGISTPEAHTLIWIRLWGGAANIIATDENHVILDAFFRRPARGEISGGTFDPEGDLVLDSGTNFPGAGKPPREYSVRELDREIPADLYVDMIERSLDLFARGAVEGIVQLALEVGTFE